MCAKVWSSNVIGQSCVSVSKIVTAVLGITIVAIGSDARAQVFPIGPNGPVFIDNGNGTSTIITPGRFNPSANLPIPGTIEYGPYGMSWIGFDGRPHGNVVDPFTGNTVLYHSRPSATPGTTRPAQPSALAPRQRVPGRFQLVPSSQQPYVPFNGQAPRMTPARRIALARNAMRNRQYREPLGKPSGSFFCRAFL